MSHIYKFYLFIVIDIFCCNSFMVAQPKNDTIAVLCVPVLNMESAYDANNLESYLQQNHVKCVNYSVDNSGSLTLKELTNLLCAELKKLKKTNPKAAIGIVAVDEACFPAIMACVKIPQNFLVTVGGIYSNGDDYYYDMQLLRGGFDGSSKNIAYRKTVYDAIQCVKNGCVTKKMLADENSPLSQLKLNSPYKSSIIQYRFADALAGLSTPLFAVFPRNDGWHNNSEYATNVQITMGRNGNDRYRTFILPDFVDVPEERMSLINNLLIYEYIKTKDNNFTKALMNKMGQVIQ